MREPSTGEVMRDINKKKRSSFCKIHALEQMRRDVGLVMASHIELPHMMR